MRKKSSFDQVAKQNAIDKAMPEEESVDDVVARLKAQQAADKKAEDKKREEEAKRQQARRKPAQNH
tara:strand:+ start:1401 stop:1598 length:198 start_codon:yes stop_codon:yes gene_type:complete